MPWQLNHQNPLTASSPLNISEMFWSWQLGHKFLRFDSNVLLAKKEGLEAKLGELESSIQSENEILKEISILADAGGIQKLQYLQQKIITHPCKNKFDGRKMFLATEDSALNVGW